MRKRYKKLDLRLSNKQHEKLMIKNLFTSLFMYGKVVTTKPRSRALKAYSLKKVTSYKKVVDSAWKLKRWLNDEFSTKKYSTRVADKIAQLYKDFAISIVMIQPRKGDNTQQFEVSIVNYDAKKENE